FAMRQSLGYAVHRSPMQYRAAYNQAPVGASGPAAGVPGGTEELREAPIIEPMETVEVVDRETSGASAPEIEELAGLIALGRERGYLTYEQISSTLEEVEITKEQVSQLHANLVEHGVDVIAEDGVSAYKQQRGGNESRDEAGAQKKELDRTGEHSRE